MALKIYTIPTAPIEENCYVALDEESRKGLIIDPGNETMKQDNRFLCPVIMAQISILIDTPCQLNYFFYVLSVDYEFASIKKVTYSYSIAHGEVIVTSAILTSLAIAQTDSAG